MDTAKQMTPLFGRLVIAAIFLMSGLGKIGAWEGTTLVVDTTLFEDHPSTSGDGVPGGAQKHVTERFALSEDGTRLVIDVVVEDPEFLAEPFDSSLQWNYTPELQLYRYNCDPELSSSGQFAQ